MPRTFASRMARGGAPQVAAGDLLDETGNVDVSGAGFHAGSVEAVEAPVGLGDRRTPVERRVKVRKELEVLTTREAPARPRCVLPCSDNNHRGSTRTTGIAGAW